MPTLTAGIISVLPFWLTRPDLPGQAHAHIFSYKSVPYETEGWNSAAEVTWLPVGAVCLCGQER